MTEIEDKRNQPETSFEEVLNNPYMEEFEKHRLLRWMKASFKEGKKEARKEFLDFLQSKKFKEMLIEGDYECCHAIPSLILDKIKELKQSLGEKR